MQAVIPVMVHVYVPYVYLWKLKMGMTIVIALIYQKTK